MLIGVSGRGLSGRDPLGPVANRGQLPQPSFPQVLSSNHGRDSCPWLSDVPGVGSKEQVIPSHRKHHSRYQLLQARGAPGKAFFSLLAFPASAACSRAADCRTAIGWKAAAAPVTS